MLQLATEARCWPTHRKRSSGLEQLGSIWKLLRPSRFSRRTPKPIKFLG